MSVQNKIRLVSSQSNKSGAETLAINEAYARVEAENSAALAAEARARAEAHARAIAEGRLRQENELLAMIEARKLADLKLVHDVHERLAMEGQLMASAHEKLRLEASLIKAAQFRLSAEKTAKLDHETRIREEQISREQCEKTSALDREASALEQEIFMQKERIENALKERNIFDKEALALLEGKLIAETARADGARSLAQERAEAIAILKQVEIEESELLECEQQAKLIAQGRINAIKELKFFAQKKVDVEILAARGIEIQLQAEEEAVMVANKHAEISAVASLAADTRATQDKIYTQQTMQQLEADTLAISEFDQKLELINQRIIGAEQYANLRVAECLIEEEKFELEHAVMTASRERIATEAMIVEEINSKLTLEENFRSISQLQLKVENEAVVAISLRIEIEQKKIDADNTRIAQEATVTEIVAAELAVAEDMFAAATLKEEAAVNSLRVAKLRAEAEAEAVQAESDLVQAHIHASKLANQRVIVAQNLLKVENEAIAEISLRMEIEQKAIDADNIRIAQEAAIKEIVAAKLVVTEDMIAAAKLKEEAAVNSLRVAKLRAEAEAEAAQAESDLVQSHIYASQLASQRVITAQNLQKCIAERIQDETLREENLLADAEAEAAQTESDLLQAHIYASQLVSQRVIAAQNLQKCIDERIQDEAFYLELDKKIYEAEMTERNMARDRVLRKQNFLNEVEARIAAEKQAALVTNQRQIAEQLLRQAALAKWKSEKQTVMALKPGMEFDPGILKLSKQINLTDQISLN